MTVREAASFGATSRQVMWLCGAPCSRRMGGPEPPTTPLISAPVVFTLNGLKPGKNFASPLSCAFTRPATNVPAAAMAPCLMTSRRFIMAKSYRNGGEGGQFLVRVGGAQECGFVERTSRELKPDRERVAAAFDESARHADGRHAGQVGAHGKDVGEIHLQRVVGLLSQPERRNRARRHRDDVGAL